MIVNLWVMLSLIPGMSNLLLGVYVLYKDRRDLRNIIFALYAFSLAVWGIFEAGHRATNSPTLAYIYIRFGGIGWCYMCSFWAHFTLVFARKDKYLKNTATYLILYVPSSIILSLFLTTDLIYKQEAVKMYFGYTSLPGEYIWIYTLYYILLYIFACYILLEVLRKGIKLERKQAKPIFIGSTAFLLTGTATNVVFPISGISVPELGTTLSIIWAVSVFYAVVKHKLFIVKPSVEDITESPIRYSLERGEAYLIKEEMPQRGYEVFLDQITHGDPGLCITKLKPQKIRRRYNLVRTPIVWLTFRDAQNSMSPRDMDGLTSLIYDFTKETQQSLIFIDCFDQIKFAVGFERALSMMRDFARLCGENNSAMLLSTPPNMFEAQQMASIESELRQEIE